jgi:hypothetical protein
MNSVDMASNLIFRAKHLQEFTVTTEVPDEFRFNGVIPFDINITGTILEAKVYGVDFDEAVQRLSEWLETCK